MAFFDKLGKKLEGMVQDAQEKTSDFIEINRLNGLVRSEREAIDSLQRNIGLVMHKRYLDGESVPDEIRTDLENISVRLEKITGLEARIEETRRSGGVPPSSTSAAAPVQPASPEPVEPAEAEPVEPAGAEPVEPAEAAATGTASAQTSIPEAPAATAAAGQPDAERRRFCTNCGVPLTPGKLFCGNCGQRSD